MEYRLKAALKMMLTEHDDNPTILCVGTECLCQYLRKELAFLDKLAQLPDETVGDRIKAMGLQTYDTALPQRWFDDVVAKTGISPYGHFVWNYDTEHSPLSGEPLPLTDRGWEILHLYNWVRELNVRR